jgi:hypothetical protein
MAATLASIPDLPTESAAWLKETASKGAGGLELAFVPEKSKALLDWWMHNGEAVLAGRPHEAIWLPSERELMPQIFEAWSEVARSKPPQPPPQPPPIPREPPSALPIHVEEPFESWAARVVDAKRRDVIWATVDYETGRSVKPSIQERYAPESSDKHLNQIANQSKPPKPPSPASPRSNSSATDTESGLPLSAPWSVVIVIIVAAIGLMWLLIKRNS